MPVRGPKPGSAVPPAGAEAFAAALVELEGELDWPLLEKLYCTAGGAGFFGAEQRAAQREAGLLHAADLLPLLEDEAVAPASLYVGAGVAELAPALAEALVLGRGVLLTNLAGPEQRELARALDAVGRRLGLQLPRFLGGELAELAPQLGPRAGHLWMTSVLTDPEAFPALHARAYGRPGLAPPDPAREAARAAGLVAEALGRCALPAVLTTTDEELEHVLPVARRLGLALEVPEHGRLSAVVGDPVRHCVLRAGPAGARLAPGEPGGDPVPPPSSPERTP